MYEEYLAHFGIKGMKWGVRKDKDKSSSSRKKKKVSEMSDQELQKAINRKNLERQYKASNKSKVAKRIGAIAGGVLGVAAMNVARNTVQKYIQKGVGEIETRAESYKQAMRYTEDFLSKLGQNSKWS